ncbi:MAG: hypothetical protein VX465_01930, partial [Pseudomonadota bacterium]|nr:hypothetical protein [Pseudomonadota bacterium]
EQLARIWEKLCHILWGSGVGPETYALTPTPPPKQTETDAVTEARGLIRSATAGPAKTSDATLEESGAY